MSAWPTVELGDCVDLTVGFPFKSQKFIDQSTDAIRLLRGDNVAQGLLRWEGAKHWAADEAPQYEGYALRERDVILAMDRPWIEAGLKYAYVRRSDLPCLLVQRVARLRGTSTLSTDYLRYIIGSPMFTAHVQRITTGVNVPHISARDIKRFQFTLPPIDVQCRIAAILGAYDDLIEVNRRRIVLLESTARGLFEEWFIRFRSSGHESGEIVDTPHGPRPATWKHVRLDEILVLQRGFDLPTSARSPGPFFVISASGRHGVHTEAKVKGPGVVTGRSGTIGKVHLVFEDHWPLNTTLYVKEFKRGGPAFASLLLKRLNLATSSSGAAVPTLNRNHVHGLPIAVPPNDLVDQFEDVAMVWLRLAHNLESQIERLTASRDLLLPRLISGQLSVAAAERELLKAA